MSNNFGSGMAVGMALGHSAGRSSGKREATEHFDDEECASIARVLLANPAFAKAVRDTIDDLNRTFGKPETYVPESTITPATRTGFLWLFHKAAEGAEADRIRGQARKTLSDYFGAHGKDVEDDYIESVAHEVAEDAESYDENYELGRGAEFVMQLTPQDYGHMARIGTIESYLNSLFDIADSKSSAREQIEETDGLTLKNDKGRVYNRMLVNTVQAYAAAAGESLTAYYNKAIGTDAASTANDNSDEPVPGAKRAGGPRLG
jgi:hypothetical protein